MASTRLVPNRLVRLALRWATATLCGGGATFLLLFWLATRVETAVAAGFPDLHVDAAEDRCENGFVASGVRFLSATTVVGFRPSLGAALVPIPDAALYELEGPNEHDWNGREELAGMSGASGRLEIGWTRHFRDRYVCGELVDSWQQASRLFVVRAPGCEDATLVVSPEWRREEVELVCPGRASHPSIAL